MRISRFLPIASGLFAIVVLATPATAFSWASIRILTSSGNVTPNRSLAVSGSVAHVVYSALGQVAYRRSTDGGRSWHAARLLATPSASVYYGAGIIASSGNRVFTLYESQGPTGIRFWLRRSLDGGQTWKAPQLIASAANDALGQAAIAIAGKRAYIAWSDHNTGSISLRESVDGGVHWNGPFTLAVTLFDSGSGKEGFVQVAASGSRVYVAWVQTMSLNYNGQGIKLLRSVDGGAHWLAMRALTASPVKGGGGPFSMAASGARVVASYTRASGVVAIARSSDGGKTIHIADLPGSHPYQWHAIGISGANVRFIGVPPIAGLEIDDRRSADGGGHWSAMQVAANAPASPGPVSVAVGELGTVMAWCDDPNYPQTAVRTRFGN